MSNWIVSVPVWGEAYFATFCRVAAPSLLAAVARLGAPVLFMIHTDQPAHRVHQALPGCLVQVRPVPSKTTYVTLQESHADAVAQAAPGDRVVLLNADIAISGNLLVRCAEHFDAGKHAVVMLGIRTAAGEFAPPAGAAPSDLLEWAWEHRHQIVRDLEWPAGGSMLPTNLFFTSGDRGEVTVARGFHLHPVAIVKQENTSFKSTIDGDLLDCFDRARIHVVVSPHDCSMCEVSPPDRRFPIRAGALSVARVAASMRSRASATHRWLFEHRIVVRGPYSSLGTDVQIARDILEALARLPVEERRTPRLPRQTRGIMPAGRRGRPRAS